MIKRTGHCKLFERKICQNKFYASGTALDSVMRRTMYEVWVWINHVIDVVILYTTTICKVNHQDTVNNELELVSWEAPESRSLAPASFIYIYSVLWGLGLQCRVPKRSPPSPIVHYLRSRIVVASSSSIPNVAMTDPPRPSQKLHAFTRSEENHAKESRPPMVPEICIWFSWYGIFWEEVPFNRVTSEGVWEKECKKKNRITIAWEYSVDLSRFKI